MIICKEGHYAFTGKTAEEAYGNYLKTDADCDCLTPSELEWFSASEMKCSITLSAKPKADVKPQKK